MNAISATPTPEEAARALETARLKAAVGFEFMVELLTIRGFDPSVTTKNALEIAEHLYKVSGMAQKQAPQVNLPSVKLTFNASNPHTGARTPVEIDVTPSSDALSDEPPAFLELYPPVGVELNELVIEYEYEDPITA